jgi:diguanylate cyclase (GGDEF)-like protein
MSAELSSRAIRMTSPTITSHRQASAPARGASPSGRGLDGSTELIEFALELAKSVDRRATAGICAGQIAKTIDGAVVAVFLVDEAGTLVLEGRGGEPSDEFLAGALDLVERVYAEGEADAIAGVDLQGAVDQPEQLSSIVAVPISSWEGRFGTLLIGVPDGCASQAELLHFLRALADLTAASLANTHRLHLTSAEARRDPLTGLSNRRAFHEHLDYALEQEARRGGELALVLFDLDRLKEINDSEGHLVGDRALRDLARLTLGVLRAGEEAFRLGGDEFAIVVEGGQEAGTRVAERVRKALARKRRGQELPSISAGVATFPVDAADKEELVHRADLALYAAKERGKNRAVTYTTRLAAETQDVHQDAHLRREEEWWAKVLGLATRGRFGDEIGPGSRPHDVALLAEQVSTRLDVARHARESIGLAAYLTELGKLRIPETIRRKRGPLTERDWRVVRECAEVMASTLAPMGYLGGVSEILRATRERWDGKGYPGGLAGDEIPLGARIVAVCDAYCALTSGRSYRPARSHAGALLELKTHAGAHFDPMCVEALAAVVEGSETAPPKS